MMAFLNFLMTFKNATYRNKMEALNSAAKNNNGIYIINASKALLIVAF